MSFQNQNASFLCIFMASQRDKPKSQFLVKVLVVQIIAGQFLCVHIQYKIGSKQRKIKEVSM